MTRYLTYSSLFHILVVSGFAFANLFDVKPKEYFVVDFMAGGAGSPASSLQQEEIRQESPQKQAKAPEPVKTKVINPQEDLLVKAKKNKKDRQKVKEVISTLPIPSAPPIPSAKPLNPSKSSSGASSSAIPGVGSGPSSGGVGIGFGEGSGTPGSGAGNFPYTWYVHSMKKKLDANWNVSSGFSQRIFAQVAFVINRNGSISDIEVEQSSQNEVFDRHARRAVEYANPLPPLPTDFPEPSLRVHVRFSVKK